MNKNLIPLNQRAKDEQREIARMGGKARGKQRRMEKTCREVFKTIRDLPLTDGKLRDEMIYGLKGKGDILRVAFEMMGENDVQGVTKIPAGGIKVVKFSENEADYK